MRHSKHQELWATFKVIVLTLWKAQESFDKVAAHVFASDLAKMTAGSNEVSPEVMNAVMILKQALEVTEHRKVTRQTAPGTKIKFDDVYSFKISKRPAVANDDPNTEINFPLPLQPSRGARPALVESSEPNTAAAPISVARSEDVEVNQEVTDGGGNGAKVSDVTSLGVNEIAAGADTLRPVVKNGEDSDTPDPVQPAQTPGPTEDQDGMDIDMYRSPTPSLDENREGHDLPMPLDPPMDLTLTENQQGTFIGEGDVGMPAVDSLLDDTTFADRHSPLTTPSSSDEENDADPSHSSAQPTAATMVKKKTTKARGTVKRKRDSGSSISQSTIDILNVPDIETVVNTGHFLRRTTRNTKKTRST